VRPDLRIAHLYPDLLRTYGDRGNLLALARRTEWRRFTVAIEPIGRGDRMASRPDIVLIGGGTDRVQEAIGEDLLSRRDALADAVAEGTVVLGICGGYQLLGHRYVDAEGAEIPGLGLLDVETHAGTPRIIGRVQAEGSLWGHPFELFGFENHGGRTVLGEAATALASVPKKQGNNGDDGTEGAVQGSIVGTYLHGPVLPANPELADAILQRALERVTGGGPLEALDDSAEREAHELARKLKR
jgi:lipid II isoglutaminyl synthase (glutamine-hydrolysing)